MGSGTGSGRRSNDSTGRTETRPENGCVFLGRVGGQKYQSNMLEWAKRRGKWKYPFCSTKLGQVTTSSGNRSGRRSRPVGVRCRTLPYDVRVVRRAALLVQPQRRLDRRRPIPTHHLSAEATLVSVRSRAHDHHQHPHLPRHLHPGQLIRTMDAGNNGAYIDCLNVKQPARQFNAGPRSCDREEKELSK